jgi:ABC-type antimicrobial peptide transport system permease subunit
LSKFSGTSINGDFNYSSPNLAIPNSLISQISALPSVSLVDSRLVLNEQVQESDNFSIDSTTMQITQVGDSRQGNSIVIGVNPENLSNAWSVEGRFLNANDDFSAAIGDSIDQSMYSTDPSKGITLANPLVEGITMQNSTFDIVGVCVDPLNNGFVTYVPLERLENLTGISSPNLLLVTLKGSNDQSAAIAQIKTLIQSVDPSLNVFSLNSIAEKNANFLASNWQTIMILPLFTLASAALCMVAYMMLSVDEQHQEFAVLRAIGAKPKFVISVLAIQSIIVLASSFGVGISLGTIITLLILMPQPIVTSFTILDITGWLLAALAGMFILSLYPAFKLAKASILKIMT